MTTGSAPAVEEAKALQLHPPTAREGEDAPFLRGIDPTRLPLPMKADLSGVV
jgi:hypothetical protein